MRVGRRVQAWLHLESGVGCEPLQKGTAVRISDADRCPTAGKRANFGGMQASGDAGERKLSHVSIVLPSQSKAAAQLGEGWESNWRVHVAAAAVEGPEPSNANTRRTRAAGRTHGAWLRRGIHAAD